MAFPHLSRKVTLNEYLYQVGETLVPPFSLQYIIEGNGRLGVEEVRNSLIQLSEKLPILRLVLKGRNWSLGDHTPALIVHEKPFSGNWNDPIFHSPLNAEKNSYAELHLFQGKNSTLVFRVLHKLMDAKGIQLVIRSFFALLRGEPIEQNTNFSSDQEVQKRLWEDATAAREGYQSRWPGFPLSPDHPVHYQTEVITFDFRLEGAIARCGSWYADKLGETCRMMIPVDLRRHDNVPSSASNLSLPIYLPIRPGQGWQEIQSSLLSALKNNQELAGEKLEQLALMIPQPLLRLIMTHTIKRSSKISRFPMSGILSDNGFIDLQAWSTPSFTAKNVISLPVYIPLAPLCIAVVHHAERTNIAFSLPVGRDIQGLKSSLSETLSAGSPEKKPKVISPELPPEEVRVLKSLWAEILGCPMESVHPEVTFHDLGGDSLKLLFMLSALTSNHPINSESAFFNEVLNTGGHITLRSLIEIMDKFR
ncbi:MAG: acyl carrier protein [Bacteroidia bacterium]|nr:acyl carrier protein [Bacteroidia bacterium]